MATTTPNYGWDVPTSTDYVADGAVAIETLGDDIDASLFSITGGKNVGLVHLNTTSFTSQTTINFNNIFTSAYDNYVFWFSNMLGSTAADVYMQMRTGTTTTAGTAYWFNRIYGNYSSGVTGAGSSSTDKWTTGLVVQGSGRTGIEINLFNPFLSELTSFTSNSLDNRTSGAVGLSLCGGFCNNQTSYDGISITSNANLTGTISVFGVRK
jgi:hypothetical protein